MPRSIATRKTNTLRPRNEEEDKEDDHAKAAERFHGNRADMLPNGTGEQAPFEKGVCSEWMMKKRIPMNYDGRKLELLFSSAPAFSPASMKREGRRARMFLRTVYVKLLCSVVCMLLTISELSSLLPKVQVSNLITVSEEKNRQDIQRDYFAERKCCVVPLQIRSARWICRCFKNPGRNAE